MAESNDPQRAAEEVTAALRAAFGTQLRSVLLYGSTARGEHIEGLSDINLLVLLSSIEPAGLAAAAPTCRVELERHRAIPLLMNSAEWARAADAFAIELADMQDAHVVMAGEDPVVQLSLDMRAVRLQAEREIRGRLVRLHTAMLMMGDDAAQLGALLTAALPAFATYLRASLRLAGRPVPAAMPDVLSAGAELVGADVAPLLRVHEARVTGAELTAAVDEAIVRGFDAAAVRTAAWIDTHQETS
jgi:predicted nucleotidyltransferase